MTGYVITDAAMTRFYYIATSEESARKWLRYRVKHQARGERYAGPFKVALQVEYRDDPPPSIPRSEFTGEQLRAAYEA